MSETKIRWEIRLLIVNPFLLKAFHIKHLKIFTELDNKYVSVLPVKIHDPMNHWIVDISLSI